MTTPYRVCVLGFSAFERSALASYFRLASNRSPAYEQAADADEAQFLVVDADHAVAVQTAREGRRLGDAVFIGARPPEGATAWMLRPIDPLHVLRELDAMVAARTVSRAPLSGQVPVAPGGQRPLLRTPAAPGPVPARRAGDPISLLARADRATPIPPRPAHRATQALLVDDSDIALRYLESRLLRYGLSTDHASTSGKAIELLARRAYDFVFLDVELGAGSELDGLALCQHIKRQHRHAGGAAAPVVVMVSAHHSELDRVRGMLAGSDGYLAKPLDEPSLSRLLVQHGVTPPAPTPSPAASGTA